MDVANVDYTFWNDVLTIDNPPISEKQWLEAVDFRQRGVSEIIGLEEPKVFEVDTYISGVIRELNRLGLYTIACCGGHEKRQPHIYFHRETNMEKVMKLFRALRVNVHLSPSYPHRVSLRMNREQLLDLAENMRNVQIDWLEQEEQYIQKTVFLQELEQLLSVSGESGNEGDIRAVVYEN